MSKILITHSTQFHADEVFSTALLKILFKEHDISIMRTIKLNEVDEEILNSPDTIIYDIGLGKFDHHQKDAEVRPNGIKYAAFGLLWREFGDWDKYPTFDEEFVQPIDNHDNGGEKCAINDMIRLFNPTIEEIEHYSANYIIPDSSARDILENRRFSDAVDIAEKIIKRKFAELDNRNAAWNYIDENGRVNENGTVLFLDKYADFIRYCLTKLPTVKVVIYPHLRGGFAAQVLPKAINTMESDYQFPKEWCGKPQSELPGSMTFCHNSGFLCNCTTMESAYEAAKQIIRK